MNKDLLYRFFKGDVSIEEGQKIKVWMEASPENERSFYRERKLFDALLLHGLQYKSTLRTNIYTLLDKIKSRGVQAAAIIMIALSFNYLYVEYKQRKDDGAISIISVPEGQRVNINLPDGTNVWLNARTTLQYPVSFNRKYREVKLNGEAYFEVKRNERKPFIVKTDKFDIEVLGTKFNVDAYQEASDFEAALMHGSIKITPQEHSSQPITLEPGYKITLNEEKLQVAKIDSYEAYRWKEGLISFSNESFSNIMKDFEKYYGIKIVMENKNVLQTKFTGKFRLSDGIDYALRILQKNIDFRYQRNEEKHIIYIK